MPEDIEQEPWFDLYFRAWERLRFDRFYGAFGGETPISYMATSRYAEDFGIRGGEFEAFVTFIHAIDDEWAIHREKTSKNDSRT